MQSIRQGGNDSFVNFIIGREWSQKLLKARGPTPGSGIRLLAKGEHKSDSKEMKTSSIGWYFFNTIKMVTYKERTYNRRQM